MGMGRDLSPAVFGASLGVLFLLGLAFIGGLYYILNGNPLIESINYIPVTQEPSSFSLQINSPENYALVFDPNLLLTGKTSEMATVIVTNGSATLGFDADSKGNFSKVVTLTEGANLLNITAFDKTGASKTEMKKVYYSKEKLNE